MKGKFIGEINGIKIYSNKKVPLNEVWIEEGHRPNPTFKGGFLDTLAFPHKSYFIKGKRQFNKLKKVIKLEPNQT
jgi:hypothetical protein